MIERVELAAACPDPPPEPPDEPPDEPRPADALPFEPFADTAGLPGWPPPAPGLALADGETVGTSPADGEPAGTAPGQCGAGAPGLRPPARFAADEPEWWPDPPGTVTTRSGTAASRAAAATAMSTTRVRRDSGAATGAGTRAGAGTGTTAADPAVSSGGSDRPGEKSAGPGTAVTLGSTTPRRIAGPAVLVIGVLLPPPEAGRGLPRTVLPIARRPSSPGRDDANG